MPAPPTRAKVRAPAPPPRPPLSDRARDAERRLAEARLEARALLAEQGLRRLKESAALDYGRGWTEAYGQLLDRFQHGRDWLPIGSPTSRKHGANFPFFQTETELALVRDLSRILVGTNNHAWGMLRGLRSFVIGTGYRFAVTPRRPKKAASRKAAKFLTAFLDAWAARTRWMERQRELFWRCHRDGDALLRLFPDDGWLKLRFAWPEQLTQPPGETFEEWGFGVRADPEDAEDETAYYLASVADPARGDFVPAAQVLHLKANADTGIKRGLPDFSFGTKDALDAAGRLTRNLGEGSAVRAAIAFIRQHAAATEAEVSAWNTADADYTAPTAWGGGPRPVTDHDPGEVHDIPEGLEYAGAPSDAGTAGHAQVVQVLLRSAGVRWNAPEWLVSGDASNMGAYTSSLVAESPFVRSVTEAQDYYRSRYLEVVRRAVVCAEAHGVVERGTLALCLLDLEPPTPEVRDKAAESQRAAVEIPLGVDSRQRYCSSQGRDFDQVARENQEYNDKFGGDGQQLPDQPPDGGGGGAGAPTPAAGGDGDEDPMALPESLLESEEVTDIRLRLLEADAPAGKVWKEITYTSKSGKQVTQKRLVNAPKAAAAKKTAAKKEPVKKVAGKAAAAKAVKKPAAKKEPAKKPEKPAKADPKATAEAVHAALRGDPEKLTPEAVKDLHAKLNTLTVGQIQAIKKVHDLRGGKTKAEHVAALVKKAGDLKKAADAAKAKAAAGAGLPKHEPEKIGQLKNTFSDKSLPQLTSFVWGQARSGTAAHAALRQWAAKVKDPSGAAARALGTTFSVPVHDGDTVASVIDRGLRREAFLADKPKDGESKESFVHRHYPELKGVTGLRLEGVSTPQARFAVHDLYEMRDHAALLSQKGVAFHVSDEKGTPAIDHMGHLKGVQPRGWPPGKTWDDAPGAYSPATKRVLSGSGSHGAVSLMAHEAGHAVGDQLGLDNDPETIGWHEKLHAKLPEYLRQGGPGGFAGRQEMVAETIGIYVRRGKAGVAAFQGIGPEYADWLDRKMKGMLAPAEKLRDPAEFMNPDGSPKK